MPKDNKNNRTYTEEQREAMVSKLLPPNNMSITELSAKVAYHKLLYMAGKRELKKGQLKKWKKSKIRLQVKSFISLWKPIYQNMIHQVLQGEYLYVDEVKSGVWT